jgi:small-conductance mechanosensitive channel
MNKIILKNGLFGGLIVSIVMVYTTLTMKANPDNEPSIVIGIASMLFAFFFVVWGIKQQREANGGIITFGKAFVIGLLVSVVISTLYVLVWLVIYYNFFPNFMEQYSEMILKKTSTKDLAAKTEEMNQMIGWYKNPFYIILLTYMEILPIGILVSAVNAFIFKRKKV